jgi:hypothetical protein
MLEAGTFGGGEAAPLDREDRQNEKSADPDQNSGAWIYDSSKQPESPKQNKEKNSKTAQAFSPTWVGCDHELSHKLFAPREEARCTLFEQAGLTPIHPRQPVAAFDRSLNLRSWLHECFGSSLRFRSRADNGCRPTQ